MTKAASSHAAEVIGSGLAARAIVLPRAATEPLSVRETIQALESDVPDRNRLAPSGVRPAEAVGARSCPDAPECRLRWRPIPDTETAECGFCGQVLDRETLRRILAGG